MSFGFPCKRSLGIGNLGLHGGFVVLSGSQALCHPGSGQLVLLPLASRVAEKRRSFSFGSCRSTIWPWVKNSLLYSNFLPVLSPGFQPQSFLNHNSRKTFIEAFIMYQTVGHILHLGFFISSSENPERGINHYQPLVKTKKLKQREGVFGPVLIGGDAPLFHYFCGLYQVLEQREQGLWNQTLGLYPGISSACMSLYKLLYYYSLFLLLPLLLSYSSRT